MTLLLDRIARVRSHALRRTSVAALALVTGVAQGCATAAAPSAPAPAPGPTASDAALRAEPFLDTLQRRTFDWFWETTDSTTGLTPDRWPTRDFSSVAAIGFGLSSYVVGAERGYVSREAAARRTLTTLRFLWQLPQGEGQTGIAGHHGFFYHFLRYEDGLRFHDVELSSIDTALLLMGALTCQQYFDREDATETSIRAYADSLYRRADWKWFIARAPLVSMGWKPDEGFNRSDWHGYMEAMLVYVLALASPTHPMDAAAWTKWSSTYQWREFYGYPHVNFAPLFGHQYSHVWIDFRGIQDEYMRGRGIDYFENSRRAVLSQRAYAIDNPQGWKGYGADIWGLTASDGPMDTTITIDGKPRLFFTYSARGAAADEIRDDGTIAPTAVGGAVPFAPEITIPALKAMRARLGDDLFTRYGFLDAFNLTYPAGARVRHGRSVPGRGWIDGDYLGIDQGPILLMIENYRSDLVWRLMRQSPYVREGLKRAGFTGGWLR